MGDFFENIRLVGVPQGYVGGCQRTKDFAPYARQGGLNLQPDYLSCIVHDFIKFQI